MIRLRVSDLDSWLRYTNPPFEAMGLTTEQFLDRMRRKRTKTLPMLAGSALHKLLETAEPGQEFGSLVGVEVDGIQLRFDISYEFALPVEREPQIIERMFSTRWGDVLLRGRIDGKEADGTIVDYKLSGRRLDAESLARSLQWRAYALIEGAARFKYLVFLRKFDIVYDDYDRYLDVWIHDVHEMVFWSYPEMEIDVQEAVSDLAGFVVEHVPELVTDGGPMSKKARVLHSVKVL